MNERAHSVFFLHGGPGASAIPERQWFGTSLDVYWWDQPRPSQQSQQPFAELLEAVEAEIEAQARAHGGPITLLTHSFGARLALQVADRLAEYLCRMVLLAPTYDLGQAYARLARRLAPLSCRRRNLLAAADALTDKPQDASAFHHLVNEILATPNFLDLYWTADAVEQREWLKSLITDPRVFDFTVFHALAESQLSYPPVVGKQRFAHPVTVVLGAADPLLDIAQETRRWQEYWPQAHVQVLDAGHFIQFELCPELWYPA